MTGISPIGVKTTIGIGGSSSRNWTQRYITSAYFYELWKVTGAGTMTGLKRGDPMTITRSGLNAIYAVPDTAPYKTRDTDYVFHKSNGDVSTACDGNRLIAYDFAKIIVKYLDVAPYAIEYIGILDTGQSVTNQIRDDFHLSIWWDNVSSDHGRTKGNRTGQQSVWTAESVAVAPTVTTTAISALLAVTASSGGNVTDAGGGTVSARGVCWNTSANPTTANSKTTDSTGTGAFTSSITSLSAGTTYHVRAYATNEAGTSYGADVTFSTAVLYDTFTDTNGTRLNAHTMNAGAGWNERSGVWTTVNGKVAEATSSDAIYQATCEAGKANVDITINVDIPAAYGYYANGIIFRWVDATHHWILLLERDGATSAYMALRLDGSVSNSVNISPPAGTTVTLRVVTSGNSIKTYLNGTLVNDISNTAHNDKTVVGIAEYRGSQYYDMGIDNFITF